jgi:DNA-binding NarL/FixJ family response regulator
MVRVLIVDDHPLFRRGLSAELAKSSDIVLVGEAADGDEAIVAARARKPDLVLLDIELPGKSGLEVLKQLHAEMPEVKVLVLSAYPDRQYAIRCLKDGAQGYVTKKTAAEEIMVAVRKVMRGGKYVSDSLADLLAAQFNLSTVRMPHEELSDREFQVLCLLGQGKTVSQIAEILSLSLSTISTHRAHILEKMKMRTTAQLVRYVLDNNLINIEE